MNTRRFLTALLVAVGLAMGCQAVSASTITVPANGDFESFSNGIPVGWSLSTTDTVTPNLESTTVTSPFTDYFPLSTASVALAGTDGSDLALYQSIAPQIGVTTIGFDFYYGSGTGTTGNWTIDINGPPANGGGNLNYTQISLGGSGSNPSFNLGAGGPGITDNTWYQFVMTFNPGTQSYSYTLTPYGGATFSNSHPIAMPFTSNFPIEQIELNYTNFTDSGVSDPTLYVDNIFVVPEPSTWLMLLGGLGVLALFRRSVRRGQRGR